MSDTLSGAAGNMDGHTLGQGFIDACTQRGLAPATDENYTAFPGASVCITDQGLLIWTPGGGVRFTAPTQ